MKFTPEHCENIRKAKLGRPRLDMLGDRNPANRPEVKAKISETLKRRWQDPEHVKKCLRRKRGPNQQELLLQFILDHCSPGEWCYTGEGQQVILTGEGRGRKPDFIHRTKKLIVEMFGCHYHTKEEEQLRIEEFKNLGYQTLIVWDTELVNPYKVADRVKEFMNAQS